MRSSQLRPEYCWTLAADDEKTNEKIWEREELLRSRNPFVWNDLWMDNCSDASRFLSDHWNLLKSTLESIEHVHNITYKQFFVCSYYTQLLTTPTAIGYLRWFLQKSLKTDWFRISIVVNIVLFLLQLLHFNSAFLILKIFALNMKQNFLLQW